MFWPTPTHGDALKTKGLLRLEITNFAQFANSGIGGTGRKSDTVYIRGMPWKLCAEIKNKMDQDGEQKCLGAYVQCQMADSDVNWNSVSTSLQIWVLAHKEDKKDIAKLCSKRLIFNAKNDNWGFGCIAPVQRIMNPDNGWYDLDRDSVIVEAEICVEQSQTEKFLAIKPHEVERLEMYKNGFANLLAREKATDVHFLVGDKKERLAAHKLILLTFSEVFEKMFPFNAEQNRDPSEHIEVPDVTAEAFRIMLNFIYTGQPQKLDWFNLFDVFKAAKKYMVIGLIQACTSCLDHLELNDENVLLVLGHARQLDEKNLAERCWKFVDRNVYAVIGTQNFLEIDQKLLEELLARDTLEMSKKPIGEIALWEAAIRWADEKCHQKHLECSGPNRRQMLGGALYKIRIPRIGHKDLAEKIEPCGILRKEEMANVRLYQVHPNLEAFTKSILDLENIYQLKFDTQNRA